MMNLEPKQKAGILVEALPYIQEYTGKIVVVKYGGNAMVNSDMLKKIGKETKFVKGLRYTDEETMDIVQMILCGKVNKNLVRLLEKEGGHGVGLSGMDGSLFQAVPLKDPDGTEYGYVGDITGVNETIVLDALDAGYIPVVSSVAAGADNDTCYNINADTAAEKLAVALKAKKLILLTDVCGLMSTPGDASSLIPKLKVSEVPPLVKSGVISGGMIPKVDCCVEAIRQGVERANIQDGRIPHSLLIEILSQDGVGTMFS